MVVMARTVLLVFFSCATWSWAVTWEELWADPPQSPFSGTEYIGQGQCVDVSGEFFSSMMWDFTLVGQDYGFALALELCARGAAYGSTLASVVGLTFDLGYTCTIYVSDRLEAVDTLPWVAVASQGISFDTYGEGPFNAGSGPVGGSNGATFALCYRVLQGFAIPTTLIPVTGSGTAEPSGDTGGLEVDDDSIEWPEWASTPPRSAGGGAIGTTTPTGIAWQPLFSAWTTTLAADTPFGEDSQRGGNLEMWETASSSARRAQRSLLGLVWGVVRPWLLWRSFS